MTWHVVSCPDGRDLEVLEQGDPDGLPWLLHGGSPSAAVPYEPFDRAARRAGMRLLTYSRPGYGGSTPRAPDAGSPRVVDDVADAVRVLDQVDATEFVTLGWSGGGPRALACAALLPERCRAAATIAGVAPRRADGLDWYAGMAPENVAEYAAADEGPTAYTAYLVAELLPVMAADAAELAAGMGELLTPVDRSALDHRYTDWLAETMHRAAAQGVVGVADDGIAAVSDWGFDVDSIAVPVSVWQGDQDAMVPFAHGVWLAARVPGARAHLEPGEGHLSLLGRIDEILAELRQAAGLT